MRTLGIEIRETRHRQKLTLRATAEMAGISPSLLSLIERGEHAPERDTVASLARALSVDEDRWCVLAGKIPQDIELVFEQSFISRTREEPEFLRTMRQILKK